jgi:hypothetical protein
MSNNIDTIVKAIQVIVKEEVKKQLKSVVKEEVSKQVKTILKEMKSNNKTVNEAYTYDSRDINTEGWPTMKHNLTPQRQPRVIMEDMDDVMGVPVGMNVQTDNPAQNVVLNALNRDYSALMKAMKKG